MLELTVLPSHRAMMNADVVLPCTFHVDKPPVNPHFLAIRWSFQDKVVLTYDNTVNSARPALSLDLKATRNGNASLCLSQVKISDGGIYKCLVIYSPDRQEKVIQLDIQAPPAIRVIKKKVIIDEETLLRCSVTGFYPSNITVIWLRDRKVLEGSIMCTPQRNADGTYRVNSTVIITPTEENRNQTLSCRVHHASLREPLQENVQLVYRGSFPECVTYECYLLVSAISLVLVAVLAAAVTGVLCKARCPKNQRAKVPTNESDIQERPNETCRQSEAKKKVPLLPPRAAPAVPPVAADATVKAAVPVTPSVHSSACSVRSSTPSQLDRPTTNLRSACAAALNCKFPKTLSSCRSLSGIRLGDGPSGRLQPALGPGTGRKCSE
ncbi:tapasin-like isoform X2 [Ascaphus truei]